MFRQAGQPRVKTVSETSHWTTGKYNWLEFLDPLDVFKHCSQPHHRGKDSITCERTDHSDDWRLCLLRLPLTWLQSNATLSSYFLGYLDHLQCHSPGLSSQACGLSRTVPLAPSVLHHYRLHDLAPDTSCKAARRCEHPQCCHESHPGCWGLETRIRMPVIHS